MEAQFTVVILVYNCFQHNIFEHTHTCTYMLIVVAVKPLSWIYNIIIMNASILMAKGCDICYFEPL